MINDLLSAHPDAKTLLDVLQGEALEILGDAFTGMYLDGSLTSGDFDPDSDIDFVIVTEGSISEKIFLALQAMHGRLAGMDTVWAIQLEGSYLSRNALRRYDPADTLYPNIERGWGELLKLVRHDETWDTHRWVLRQRGIPLAGPPLETLIDPVSPNQLRQAMQPVLWGWAAHFLEEPDRIKPRGYQSYIVLTMCRILFTLQNGEVASKPEAVRWAQAGLDAQWGPLIDRAWEGRHHPDTEAPAEDTEGTKDFIRFVLSQSTAGLR